MVSHSKCVCPKQSPWSRVEKKEDYGLPVGEQDWDPKETQPSSKTKLHSLKPHSLTESLIIEEARKPIG